MSIKTYRIILLVVALGLFVFIFSVFGIHVMLLTLFMGAGGYAVRMYETQLATLANKAWNEKL